MTRDTTRRRRRRACLTRWPLAVLSLLAAAGCINRHTLVPCCGAAEDPPGAFAPIPAGLDEPGDAAWPNERAPPGGDNRLYRTVDVRIPSEQDDGQPGRVVVARLFESRLPGRHPLVIILPIYGSHFRFPTKVLASALLHHTQGRASVLLMQSNAPVLAWDLMGEASDVPAFRAALTTTRRRVEASAVDVRRLLDWALAREAIDPARVGMVGFSVGGLVASLVLVSDARVRAGALVMTGAHPADVFTECVWEAADVRRDIMKRFGWNLARYRQEMEDVFGPLDVAQMRPLVSPERLLFADAASDSCFPAISRDALWNAMGRPRRITFAYDHRFSFLSMTFLGSNYLTSEIVSLFDQAL